MVMEIPLDLVAEVRCRFGRDCARSNANFKMRSTPIRVITVCWLTNSRGVSGNIRPPTDEYSPSVFSRTTQKSMSPGLRLADGAEIDRVMGADLRLPVVRHHLAVLFVIIVRREIEMVEMHLDPMLLRRRLQHAQAFRHHFLADAVAGNHRNPIWFCFAAHIGFLMVGTGRVRPPG